jgi:CDP-diacylglycerol---serine O-phosphatidyltransferase
MSLKNRPTISLVERSERVKKRLHGSLFLIPSLVTMGAFFSGFLALLMTMRGNFDYAVICIGVAIVLDGIDGKVARRLNATTAFGKEFDSLSDLLSFGVAPAILLYQWAFRETFDDFGMIGAFLYSAAAAIRLARFNIRTPRDIGFFEGLPSPGAAGALASVIYFFHHIEVTMPWAIFLALYSAGIGFLMVSTISYRSLKRVKFSANSLRYLAFVLALFVGLCWIHNRLALMLAMNIYALSGVVFWVFKSKKKKEIKE